MYLVYGHEGEPCSQTEAAKLAGYADPGNYASRLMNLDEYPLRWPFTMLSNKSCTQSMTEPTRTKGNTRTAT